MNPFLHSQVEVKIKVVAGEAPKNAIALQQTLANDGFGCISPFPGAPDE
jgi:hypothetical protein